METLILKKMGGSNSTDGNVFDIAASEAHDRVLAETGNGFKAAEAATVVYARKAMYDSGSGGAIPNTGTVGGNIFDAATTGIGMLSKK